MNIKNNAIGNVMPVNRNNNMIYLTIDLENSVMIKKDKLFVLFLRNRQMQKHRRFGLNIL